MTQLASKHPGGTEWSLDDVQHLVLDGVSWELYEHLLKEVGSRPLRLTHDNGELEIMSPLPQHELAKIALGDFVKAMIEELDLPRAGFGSTTFRRRLKKKGLEPDDCFYIQSYSRIVGKKRITIPRDPHPIWRSKSTSRIARFRACRSMQRWEFPRSGGVTGESFGAWCWTSRSIAHRNSAGRFQNCA
jgi:hypothetical protein